MKSRLIWNILQMLGVGLALALCLFFERLNQSSLGLLSSVARETMAVFRDPGTQWMVFLCAGIYFVTFSVLGKRGVRSAECGKSNPKSAFNYQLSSINFLSPDFWLCSLLLITALAYAFDYERASTSTQALVLLAGAAIGKGARLWVRWGKAETLKAEKLKGDGGKAESGKRESEKPIGAEAENLQPSTFNLQLPVADAAGFQHVSVSDFQDLPPWDSTTEHTEDTKGSTAGKAESGKRESGNSPSSILHPQSSSQSRIHLLLSVLLVLLALASVWHPEGAMQFQYRGLNRWSGPWDNPNIFGLLMGTGVVIGMGLFVSSFGFRVPGCGEGASVRFQVSGLARGGGRRFRFPDFRFPLFTNQRSSAYISGSSSGSKFQFFSISAFQRFVCLVALILCGVGLLKSYSRGAWLGAALGLAFSAFQHFRFRVSGFNVGQAFQPAGSPDFPVRCAERATGKSPEPADRNVRPTLAPVSRFIGWFGRNRIPFSILIASILVLSFWQFRQTEWHPARRVFSVGNVNDFSWRNRVAAWEGSLAMMADRPVAGFGWNQPEKIYDQFYRSPKVAEGMAIQLNHYFTLGMSLGLPALICFGMYVGLSLTRSAECGVRNWEGGVPPSSILDPPSSFSEATSQATCRAGAVVLLIGLWFDGGLFNLATAAPLWVLLELGRVGRTFLSAGSGDFRVASSEEHRTGKSGEPAGKNACPTSHWFLVSCRSCVSWLKNSPVLVFVAVLLLTGLVWAKARDPFQREWLSLRTGTGETFSAVVVMPDRGGPFPVVVFAHGAGSSAESSGEKLQQFATLGLAAVGFEYDKTNQASFDAQFSAMLEALGGKIEMLKSEKPKTEASEFQHVSVSDFQNLFCIAWVGNSLGAQRQLSFLARHPERQPGALVRLNGGMVEELGAKTEKLKAEILKAENQGHHQAADASGFQHVSVSAFQHFPNLSVWLAHGENDEVFPASDARKVAESLRAAGANVRLDIYPGRGHGFGEDQPLLVKAAAEFCAGELGGAAPVPVNVRPGFWYFWLPTGLLVCVFALRRARMRSVGRELAKAARWLTVCASVAVIGATLVSSAHLALPLFRATPTTLKLARHWCVRPELRADFDWLALQTGTRACRIHDLLEHLNLASLQRGQFAASLSDEGWQQFVLSPWIEGAGEDIAWRRELWEWMAPRVRRETDAEQAAIQVARQICLRVRFQGESPGTKNLRLSWECGTATRKEFDLIYVAALRSVGIPGRRKPDGVCEIFNGGKWIPAPRPPLNLLE